MGSDGGSDTALLQTNAEGKLEPSHGNNKVLPTLVDLLSLGQMTATMKIPAKCSVKLNNREICNVNVSKTVA